MVSIYTFYKKEVDSMATYAKPFGGYIADVPRLWFKRCDGRVFYFDELTQASITPQINKTEINAGWSLFPVAFLPGQSTFEMSCTSGKFEADLFVMTNATRFEENAAYEMPATERITLAADDDIIELSRKVAEDKDGNPIISIAGMELGDAAAAGVFTVDNTGDKAKITIVPGDLGDHVIVNYSYVETVQEANIDNKSSAIGEAIMQYPVYGSGDDCTESAIIGYVN